MQIYNCTYVKYKKTDVFTISEHALNNYLGDGFYLWVYISNICVR